MKKERDNYYPSLTPLEKQICITYVECYSFAKTAKQLDGVSEHTVRKLVRSTLGSALISDLQTAYAERSVIKRDMVNTLYLKTLPMFLGEEDVPLGVDKDGDQLIGKKFFASEARGVMQDLGKATDFYREGKDGSASVTVNVNLEALGIKDGGVGVTIEGEINEKDSDGNG